MAKELIGSAEKNSVCNRINTILRGRFSDLKSRIEKPMSPGYFIGANTLKQSPESYLISGYNKETMITHFREVTVTCSPLETQGLARDYTKLIKLLKNEEVRYEFLCCLAKSEVETAKLINYYNAKNNYELSEEHMKSLNLLTK